MRRSIGNGRDRQTRTHGEDPVKGVNKEVFYPVWQANDYLRYLTGFHSAFYEGKVQAVFYIYLHNYVQQAREEEETLLKPQYQDILEK